MVSEDSQLVKETFGDYRSILEKIVHFMSINSEAMDSNGLNGKMPLLCLFFAYARKFEKQHYKDFAFELLEESLSEELIKIQAAESQKLPFDLTTLQMGWSIQQFSTMSFFESDELNEILASFDNIGYREAELLIKARPSPENLERYIFLAVYLKDRAAFLKNGDPTSNKAHEYASELIKKLKNISILFYKESVHAAVLREYLFGIHKSEKGNHSIDAETIIKIHTKAKAEDDLETILLLKLCFPEIIGSNSEAVSPSEPKIVSKADEGMKSVYENGDIPNNLQLSKIANYGIFLLREPTSIKRTFLIHSIATISLENQNTTQI